MVSRRSRHPRFKPVRLIQTVGRYNGRRGSRSDSWTWLIRLDGTADEIDAVQCVVYELHASYSNPVKVVDTPKTMFSLVERSRGSFPVKAGIHLKTGKILHAEIKLKLFYPLGLEHKIED